MRESLRLIGGLTISLGLTLTSCDAFHQAAPTVTPTLVQPTAIDTETTIPTQPSPTATLTETPTLTPSTIPSPTTTHTATPIPAGFRVVPDVVGMLDAEARQTVIDAGLTFLYRDILDRDQPFGTIIEQEPPAGTVIPKDKFIILYRTFQAPGMWVGENCMPLLLTTKSGKLLFAAWLKEGEQVEIRTDFRFGETTISDSLMILLDDFDNGREDSMLFIPEWTGWYVISLGPFKIGQAQLDAHPEGVSAGCLWVLPQMEE